VFEKCCLQSESRMGNERTVRVLKVPKWPNFSPLRGQALNL